MRGIAICADGDEPGEEVTVKPMMDAIRALRSVRRHNTVEYAKNANFTVSTLAAIPLLPQWITIEATNELTG